MKNVYLILSLGNYESKIMMLSEFSKELYPIYLNSFITKNCFEDSLIFDQDLLQKTLQNELDKLPLTHKQTKVIVNLPIKTLEINEFGIDYFRFEKYTKLENVYSYVRNFCQKSDKADKVLLSGKVVDWRINGEVTDSFIWDENVVNTLGWRIYGYFVKGTYLDSYLSFFKKLDLKPINITCDSLVINHLLTTQKRTKASFLLNIGHLTSSLDIYFKNILVKQIYLNFGIRSLTKKISNITFVSEKEAIDILKIYLDLFLVDPNLELVNHFSSHFFNYQQIKISDLQTLILEWIDQLIILLNYHFKDLNATFKTASNLYIYSSMNILEYWFSYIQKRLEINLTLDAINPKIFGFDEVKYYSLYATATYFHEENKSKFLDYNCSNL